MLDVHLLLISVHSDFTAYARKHRSALYASFLWFPSRKTFILIFSFGKTAPDDIGMMSVTLSGKLDLICTSTINEIIEQTPFFV